jgi:hypothetical protein
MAVLVSFYATLFSLDYFATPCSPGKRPIRPGGCTLLRRKHPVVSTPETGPAAPVWIQRENGFGLRSV